MTLFFGCTEKVTRLDPPQAPLPNKEFVVIRDYDTTWNALIRALDGQKGRAVASENKEKGTIVLKTVPVPSEEFCDCGTLGGSPLQGRVLRKTVIQVRERAPRETLIVISCQYEAVHVWKDIYGRPVRRETIRCISNGKYELELYVWVAGYMSP